MQPSRAIPPAVLLESARKSRRHVSRRPPSDTRGCRPRVKSASGCSQRRKEDLRDNLATPHDVILIVGTTGAPRANDRSSPLAANAGIPRTEPRVDVPKNQRLRGISMVQARVELAAHCVVRCGPLQRTLKAACADRRGQLPWRERVGQ